MNHQTPNRLLDMVKNVYNDIISYIDDFPTHIYRDSFASYKVNDFDVWDLKLIKSNIYYGLAKAFSIRIPWKA